MNSDFSDLENLISQGQFFEARSKAEEYLKANDNSRTRQLLALAISKLGMPELALETIESLYKAFPEDSESAGILGSIYKELFKKNQKTSFAIQSRDTYQKNFSSTQNYYTGINAASMSAMAGQGSRARETAAQVITLVEKLSQGFWELATLGEAYLLTKNKPKSIECYVQARKLAGNDWGKVTSVHNQLWLLNHYIMVPNEVMKLFAPPNVVAFSGHMIDHPNRSTPRFPPAIEQQVKDSIRNSIRTLNARIGYCSLACGSDILFVESMIEEGGEVNLLLPFNEEDFIKTSLAFAGQPWIDRFYKIKESHLIKLVMKGGYGKNDELFSFLSRVIYGSAILRSNSTHSEPHLLTVSSEIDLKQKVGGTKDTVARWPYPQRHVNINPDIFTTGILNNPRTPAPSYDFTKTPERILFLVYLSFEGMDDQILLDKIQDYKISTEEDPLGIIAIQSSENSKIVAFESDAGAIEFIVSLKDSLKAVHQNTLLKIVLHVGLMSISTTEGKQQLSGISLDEIKSIGMHVSAGSIFASELFASLLALNSKDYLLQYAGIMNSIDDTAQPFYNVDFLR